ncbi:MAG: PEGA domain-containing protein [Bacteroidales bacterium]|nr:PEGA domain-containing protein [Bacteroidales bacterium]
MRRSILLILGILLLTSSAFADKFIVANYKHEATNLAARVYQRKDNNDETCGLIQVRTSILNLGVIAPTGVVGSVDFKDGYYWVYLSPGTRRISFYKEGFLRLNYDLPTPVKSGETYLLNLRYETTGNSSGTNQMGFVVIHSQPEGADVYINDSATGMQTPFQNSYLSGYYRFTLKKSLYIDSTGSFEIHSGKTAQVNIALAPNYGSFTISTTPEIKARVAIDGDDKGTTPLTVQRLSPGKHSLQLNKEMYLPWQGSFTILRGKNTQRTITLKANFSTVTVNAREGDTIYIDNQEVGTESYSGRFLRGPHFIKVGHQHYYSQSKQLEVTPGQNLIETFKLQPKTGTLSVMTDPIGADIFVDDKPMGQSPKFIDSLKVGKYTVKLEKQGYPTDEKQVEITENQTTTIKETLVSDTTDKESLTNGVNVQIKSQPPGAELFIDGKDIGVTPQNIRLSLENHLFKVQKKGYLPYVKTLFINQNQNTHVNADLKISPDYQLGRQKRRRNFWLISTFLTAGTGAYSYFQANKLYSEYQTATDNAPGLHNQINTMDQVTPVALGAAGVCLVEYIIHVAKCGKLKRKIKLNPSYSKNGGALSLAYRF